MSKAKASDGKARQLPSKPLGLDFLTILKKNQALTENSYGMDYNKIKRRE